MSVFARYLIRRVLTGIALVALVAVAILTLVDFIDEVRRVRPGGYSFVDALRVIALTTPQRAYEALPVSVFIGSLLSLGQLVADNEMTALRAAGIGIWWLSGRLLGVGLVLALATIFVGEKIAPRGMELASDIRRAPPEGASGGEVRGLWIRKGDHYIHLLRGARRDHLLDVLAYRLDANGALERGLHAKSAQFTDRGWLLRDVRESVIHPDGGITSERHAERIDAILPDASVLDAMLVPAEEMPMVRLDRYLRYFDGGETDLQAYRFAWWQRLSTPLSCMVVLLLTISFTFTQPRGGGLGQRVFIGVVSGIGIYLFNRVGGHFGMLAGLPPGLAAFLPLILLSLLGLGVLVAGQTRARRIIGGKLRAR